MKKIKPKFMYDDRGRQIGVILSCADLNTIFEELEDFYDYTLINERSKRKQKTYTMEEVEKRLMGTK
jgi:hypothetical protein